MQSYIEEFQGSNEKNSSQIICINGPSGAGKGTIAQQISENLGLEKFSAGDFFRKIAAERGMTVVELSEKAGKEIDLEVDRRTLRKALQEDCVVESRLSSWVLGDFADIKIYIKASLDERARRVAEREDISLDEARQRIEKRDEDNRQRYKEYYGVDINDLSIYDLVVDNTNLGIEEQQQVIDTFLEKRINQ